MKLSDTKIRNAKSRSKPYKLTDGGNLYALITPSGGKLWRFDYRFNRKRKTLPIGSYPDVGLQKARERHLRARNLLADGIDPMADRAAGKHSSPGVGRFSFEKITREWFVVFSQDRSESHTKRVLRLFERDLFPWLGKVTITEITPMILLDTIRKIANRGAKDTAKRAVNNCGQVFEYARITGRMTINPSQGLRKLLPPAEKKHFAATMEPKRLGQILRSFDRYHGGFVVGTALRLAPLVFVRPGELRTARWADINLETLEWRYFVTKTKTNHIVPLSRQVVALLRELHSMTGSGDLVFPSLRSKERPISDGAVNAAMRALDVTKEEMTGHGFRSVARTHLSETLECRTEWIELQLAHAVPDVHGRAYNRTTFLSKRREMMQRWADYLDELKAQKEFAQPSTSQPVA